MKEYKGKLYQQWEAEQKRQRRLARNRKSARAYRLKGRYGMTVEEFDAMLSAQKGLCGMCKRRPAAVVDHDHVTGAIRELLCRQCNSVIGLAGDEEDILAEGISYLRRHRRQEAA